MLAIDKQLNEILGGCTISSFVRNAQLSPKREARLKIISFDEVLREFGAC